MRYRSGAAARGDVDAPLPTRAAGDLGMGAVTLTAEHCCVLVTSWRCALNTEEAVASRRSIANSDEGEAPNEAIEKYK